MMKFIFVILIENLNLVMCDLCKIEKKSKRIHLRKCHSICEHSNIKPANLLKLAANVKMFILLEEKIKFYIFIWHR